MGGLGGRWKKRVLRDVEDFVEVVVVADRGENALAAAGLADMLGLTRDGLGGDVAAVAVGVVGAMGFL